MNLRAQRLAAWTGPLLCLLFAIGLIGLAQFVPPPRADASLGDVVRLYSEHSDRLRAGLVLMMIGAGFVASWGSAITTQLKRIEGTHSPMTWTNLACTGANVMVVTIPVMVMIAASFRPDRNPEITQALNDLAWIMFVMVFPPVMVQELAIAIAILGNSSQTVYPRWVGYANAWCALLLVPAVLLPFFKTGVFAWHGVFEFWLAGVVFFGWVIMMTVATLGAINRQSTDSPAHGTAPTPS
ncbi:MAG TPA: hypothetical protein VGH89_18040 [Pseudonocardia sp.]